MGKQTKLDFGFKDLVNGKVLLLANEVEIFNSTFGKPNQL